MRMRPQREAIDLGGGHRMAPEDVLESHFRRIHGPPIVLRTQDVSVQVAPNFQSAIRVVAPTLAPLTQIAEELATRFPTVQPATDFRNELQRALEEAHRLKTEKRGIPAGLPRFRRSRWVTATATTLAVLGLVGVVLWLLRRKSG
jgi:hypothetical protein